MYRINKFCKVLSVALGLVSMLAFAGAAAEGQGRRLKIWFDTGGGPGESYGTVLQK